MSCKRILVIGGDAGSRFTELARSKLAELGFDVVHIDASPATSGALMRRVIIDDLDRHVMHQLVKPEPTSPRRAYGPERNYRKGKSPRW